MTNHRVQILREIARLYPELIDPLNGRPTNVLGSTCMKHNEPLTP